MQKVVIFSNLLAQKRGEKGGGSSSCSLSLPLSKIVGKKKNFSATKSKVKQIKLNKLRSNTSNVLHSGVES